MTISTLIIRWYMYCENAPAYMHTAILLGMQLDCLSQSAKSQHDINGGHDGCY